MDNKAVLKFIDEADEQDLNEAKVLIDARIKTFKMALAGEARMGAMVRYGEDKEGKIVLIMEDGVAISGEGLKKKKTLRWEDIKQFI